MTARNGDHLLIKSERVDRHTNFVQMKMTTTMERYHYNELRDLG